MENETTAKPVLAGKRRQDALPKLAIAPNARVLVRINPLSQSSQPMQGEFLGMSHYDFIILRVPSVPGLLGRLIPRTMLSVSFLQEGAINSFSSELITHSVKPALLLYSGYPDRLHITETRVHQRVSCALPIIINSKYGDGRGIITDLSMGGCRVILELTGQSSLLELAVDDEIVVQTTVSADGRPVGGAAAVRSVEGSGSQLQVGVIFLEEHPGFKAALENYLELVRALS